MGCYQNQNVTDIESTSGLRSTQFQIPQAPGGFFCHLRIKICDSPYCLSKMVEGRGIVPSRQVKIVITQCDCRGGKNEKSGEIRVDRYGDGDVHSILPSRDRPFSIVIRSRFPNGRRIGANRSLLLLKVRTQNVAMRRWRRPIWAL